MFHLYDVRGLASLLHHVHLGSAVSLIVSDVDGHLGGLEPLEPVTLTAAPLIHILQDGEKKRGKDV